MKSHVARVLFCAFLPLACVRAACAAEDHSQHQHHQHKPAAAQGGAMAQIKLPDATLVDQDGRAVKVRSDFAASRVVVIDFVYTTCTTVCPVMSALFGEVQRRLGDRAGKDVALVSLTVDPERDTPARLKAFAAKFDAGPGWRFLTGPRATVDTVLESFGAYTPNFVDHPALVMVGDAKTGQWARFYGFPSADQILAKVAEMQGDGASAARLN